MQSRALPQKGFYMRLMEAIVGANHRAAAGDTQAGLHPAEFESSLPLVALTCIDARLNALLPEALGVAPEQFIWLRNAGNIITGPLSSTMRSLALACAVKGGREIAVIGHTDCLVGKTGMMQLLDKFQGLGVERKFLPDNINEFFGIFGSERQNVIKAAQTIRSSPLVGPKIPVHGLLLDVATGKVEWLVNGYETLSPAATKWNALLESSNQTLDAFKALADFKVGEIKFPETRIGEAIASTAEWAKQQLDRAEIRLGSPSAAPQPPTPPSPPKIPMPPPIRPRLSFHKGQK